jgi:hypothetical protein
MHYEYTEDLHCLRLARQKFVRKVVSFIDLLFAEDVAKREVASILLRSFFDDSNLKWSY